MQFLNGYYIGEEESCEYCCGNFQDECSYTENCSKVKLLSSISLKMVENALWNLGAPSYSEVVSLSTMYEGERSAQIGKICSSGDRCNDTVKRTTTWTGLVGLIYPSDYGYASTDTGCANDIVNTDSTCKNNNWLHLSGSFYWTISPQAKSDYASLSWVVFPSLNAIGPNVSFNGLIRQSLYLSSNVEIIGGDGVTTPYKLSI